jgi:ABC-2 type transport system permease protein
LTAFLLAASSLARREAVRFVRQRSRVAGSLGQALLLWVLLGGGFGASFRPAGAPAGTTYAEFFYPGVIALTLLFTAIFATISAVEDRRSGFLQGVLAAPVPRSAIVLGQAAGSTLLAAAQGALLLALAPAAGIRLGAAAAAATLAVMVLMGFSVSGLGLLLAWRMDSTQGFHAVMNLILMPLWLLSGAFFPAEGLPAWLAAIVVANPLTYEMAALRRCLYLGRPEAVAALPSLAACLAVTAAFSAATFAAAVRAARRSRVG